MSSFFFQFFFSCLDPQTSNMAVSNKKRNHAALEPQNNFGGVSKEHSANSWDLAITYLSSKNAFCFANNTRHITIMTTLGIPIMWLLKLNGSCKRTLFWTIGDVDVDPDIYNHTHLNEHELLNTNQPSVEELGSENNAGIKVRCLLADDADAVHAYFANVVKIYMLALQKHIDATWKICNSCNRLMDTKNCSTCDRPDCYTDHILHIGNRYSIVFSFFSHEMCGHYMHKSFLRDNLYDIDVELRTDGPVWDGRPCFFENEMMHILENVVKNSKNAMYSFEQIVRLLNSIHTFKLRTIRLCMKMLGLTHLFDTCKCFKHPMENIKYPFPILLEETETEAVQETKVALEVNHFYKDNIECWYDNVSRLIMIVDPRFQTGDNLSVRSVSGPWNCTERKVMGEFIEFIQDYATKTAVF